MSNFKKVQLFNDAAPTVIVGVKAASTAAIATDPALVVAISPNNSITVSGTVAVTQSTSPWVVSGTVTSNQGGPAALTNGWLIANDSTGSPSFTSWTSATALNSVVSYVAGQRYPFITVTLNQGSTITGGVASFEYSTDGSSTWIPISGLKVGTTSIVSTYTLQANTGAAFQFYLGANAYFRVRLSTVITGSGTVQVGIQGQGIPVNPAPVVQQGTSPWAENLVQVGGSPVALGQTTMSASLPVTLASDQPDIKTNIDEVGGSAITLGQKHSAASVPVVIADDQTLSVTTFTSTTGVIANISPIGHVTNDNSLVINNEFKYLTLMVQFLASGVLGGAGVLQIRGSNDNVSWVPMEFEILSNSATIVGGTQANFITTDQINASPYFSGGGGNVYCRVNTSGFTYVQIFTKTGWTGASPTLSAQCFLSTGLGGMDVAAQIIGPSTELSASTNNPSNPVLGINTTPLDIAGNNVPTLSKFSSKQYLPDYPVPSPIQSAFNEAQTSIQLPGTVTPGNTLLLTVVSRGVPSYVSDVTDDAGNRYTMLAQFTGTYFNIEWYYAVHNNPNLLTPIITVPNTTAQWMAIMAEYSGLNGNLAAFTHASGTVAVAGSLFAPAIVTSAPSFMLGVIAGEWQSAQTPFPNFTPGAFYTRRQVAGSAVGTTNTSIVLADSYFSPAGSEQISWQETGAAHAWQGDCVFIGFTPAAYATVAGAYQQTTGTIQPLQVDSSGNLKAVISSAAVTQTTSPWITKDTSDMTGTTPGTAPANTGIVGGIYNSSAPAPTTGQTLPLQLDSAGNLKTTSSITGSVTVSGTVAATQSGSWTVSVSGTPDINVKNFGGSAVALGVTSAAASMPIAVASDQLLALGQTTMTNSVPVTMASNQTVFPVNIEASSTALTATGSSLNVNITGGGTSGTSSGGGYSQPKIVQKNHSTNASATSLGCTFSTANVAANSIIVSVGISNFNNSNWAAAVTDSVGNTYTLVNSYSSFAHGVFTAIYAAQNVAAGANTVTFTITGSGTAAAPVAMEIYEVSGVSIGVPFTDDSNNANDQTGSSTAVSVATSTVSQIDDFAVAVVFCESSSVTVTPGTNWANDSGTLHAGTSTFASLSQLIGTKTAATATATLSAGAGWGAVVATFVPVVQPVAVTGTVSVSNSFALDATLTGGTQKTQITDGTNALGTFANYGTSPGAVKAIQTNAFVTNTVSVSGTVAVSNSFALDATLTSGAAKTQMYDGTNVIGTSSHPVQVSLANTAANATAVKVDGSAVTQPVSIGATVSTQDVADMVGTVPGTAPAKTLITGGIYNTAAPTPTTGQTLPLQMDASGNLNVNVKVGSFTGTVTVASVGATGSGVPASVDAEGINVGGTLRGATGVNPSGTVYAQQIDITSIGGSTVSSSGGVQNVSAVLTTGSAVIGHVIADSGSTTAVTGTVTTAESQFVAQNSTTSGQVGPLVQGAVTTAAPSYTTAKTSPLSLDTTGNLRVAVTNSVTVSGSVTATCSGTVAATQSGTWTIGNTVTGADAVLNTSLATNTTSGLEPTANAGFVFNGSTWDRARSAGVGSNAASTGILASSEYGQFVAPFTAPGTILTTGKFGPSAGDSIGRDLVSLTSSLQPFVIQSANAVSTNSVTTLAASFGSNNTVGNTIVVLAACGSANGMSVTDTLGNTYTQAAVSVNGANLQSAIFYATNCKAGANTNITLTCTSSSAALEIYELNGLLTVSNQAGHALSGEAQTATNTGTGALASTAFVTPVVPNSYAFSVVSVGTASVAFSGFAPYVKDFSGNTAGTPSGLFSFGAFSQYMTGITAQAFNTGFSSEPWAACTVYFKPVAVPIEGTVLISGTPTVSVTSITPPTLTKGVQAATGFSVQELKDAGRTFITWTAQALAGVTSETLISTFNLNKAGTVTGSTGSYTITNGKTLRIQTITYSVRAGAAAVPFSRMTIRSNTAGATTNASATLFQCPEVFGISATSGVGGQISMDIPDGLEIAGNGTISIGVSHLDQATTNVINFTMVGYEY